MTQDWKEGARAVIEANLWKFDDGTYFLGQTATRIINHVEALLKEERNAVLEEVEKIVKDEMTYVETVGSFRNTVKQMIDEDIFSTIINQLKVK